MGTGAVALFFVTACIMSAGCLGSTSPPAAPEATNAPPHGGRISLPAPVTAGTVPVEKALSYRRSVREYSETPIDITDIAQLLWAAQGVTDPVTGFRTAPSAGALYPLEVYVACGNVTGLPAGVYRYIPGPHALGQVGGRDVREELYRSALQQQPVRGAPAVIVIAADYNRTTGKYGERGIRYVHMEAGHASENVYLQAYALGLGTVAIGAFDDDGIGQALGLPQEQAPLYLMPVGKPLTGIS